jgi:hypothetical protein
LAKGPFRGKTVIYEKVDFKPRPANQLLYSWDPEWEYRHTDVFPALSRDGKLVFTERCPSPSCGPMVRFWGTNATARTHPCQTMVAGTQLRVAGRNSDLRGSVVLSLQMLEIAIALIVGFALGYAVREWISRRRRQAARERRPF